MTRFRENSVPFAFHHKPQTTVLPVSILQISSIVIIKHFLLSNCHTFVVPNTTFYLWIQERKKKNELFHISKDHMVSWASDIANNKTWHVLCMHTRYKNANMGATEVLIGGLGKCPAFLAPVAGIGSSRDLQLRGYYLDN